MKKTSLVVFVVLISFCRIDCAHSEECHLKRLAALRLSEATDGTLLVPVAFEGVPAFLILNTTGPSRLTDSFAKERTSRLTWCPIPQ